MRRIWWPSSGRSWSRRHGMRLKLLLTLFVIAACGDGGGPRYREIYQDDIQGNWTFQLTDTAACAGPSFEHGTIAASLVFSSGELFLFIETPSRWSSGDLEGWVGGLFPHFVPGNAHLDFHSTPEGFFRFAGDLDNQLTLRGTVTDSLPMLSPNPCIYRARGSRN
jgi:hypothetical protein